MKIPSGLGRIGVDSGRSVAIGQWLLEALILLLVGWVHFLFATRRGIIVGVALFAIVVVTYEAPGAQGSPAFDQLPGPTRDAITLFELFVVAVGVRFASGLGKAARRAGWIRFFGAWAVGGSGIFIVSYAVSQLASTGRYSAGTLQLLAAAGVTVALLAAGAISNWAALGKALAAQRSRSTARLTRSRILAAVAKRPLAVPPGAAYSSWYAWAVCALPASPVGAHRAAEAAISALGSGAKAGAAADAARRSRWTPAAVAQRVRSRVGRPNPKFQL
jgi:hypothetical protein